MLISTDWYICPIALRQFINDHSTWQTYSTANFTSSSSKICLLLKSFWRIQKIPKSHANKSELYEGNVWEFLFQWSPTWTVLRPPYVPSRSHAGISVFGRNSRNISFVHFQLTDFFREHFLTVRDVFAVILLDVSLLLKNTIDLHETSHLSSEGFSVKIRVVLCGLGVKAFWFSFEFTC